MCAAPAEGRTPPCSGQPEEETAERFPLFGGAYPVPHPSCQRSSGTMFSSGNIMLLMMIQNNHLGQ